MGCSIWATTPEYCRRMTLHFAYGSNMSRTLMRPRCPQAVEIGCAELAHHRFVITADGYASIVPCPGSVVHGLIWRLTVRDLAALNAYERIDAGLYQAKTMAVRCGGRRRNALVYIGHSRTAGRPKPGYLDLVLAAARELDLPSDYVALLERWASSRWSAARAPDRACPGEVGTGSPTRTCVTSRKREPSPGSTEPGEARGELA